MLMKISDCVLWAGLEKHLEEFCKKWSVHSVCGKSIIVPTQILCGKQQCVGITFLVAEPSDLQNVVSQNYRSPFGSGPGPKMSILA